MLTHVKQARPDRKGIKESLSAEYTSESETTRNHNHKSILLAVYLIDTVRNNTTKRRFPLYTILLVTTN